jgi:hypothetical protein
MAVINTREAAPSHLNVATGKVRQFIPARWMRDCIKKPTFSFLKGAIYQHHRHKGSEVEISISVILPNLETKS